MLFGKRRLVLIHQADGPTVEGILVHRSADCYRVELAKILRATDGAGVASEPVDGVVEVPRERVVFLQLLAKGA